MNEARHALGLEVDHDSLLERVGTELSLGQYARARELVGELIDRLGPGHEQLGPALYFRALSREDEGRVGDLEAALRALEDHRDASWEAGASLALAREFEEARPEAARVLFDRSVLLYGRCRRTIEEANARLALARFELRSGRRALAVRHARELLESLGPVLRLEARRLEVLAHELLGDATTELPEALALYERALVRAERMELGWRRALKEKILALKSRQGPFR